MQHMLKMFLTQGMAQLQLLAHSRGMVTVVDMFNHQQTQQPIISQWPLKQATEAIQGVHQLAMPKVYPCSREGMVASMTRLLRTTTNDSLLLK